MPNTPFSWETPPVERTQSRLRRVKQIDDVHCGPATLQMLLGHIGIDVTQQALAQAINAEEFIDERGTRPDELGKAVSLTAPQAQLWCKEYTSLEDLEMLTKQFHYPVGVEWQNLFYESVEEEWEDTNGYPEQFDFGHYSIITSIDKSSDEVIMVDPYHQFNDNYRFFSLKWFVSRWWDDNPMKDPQTGRIYTKRDHQISFIITLKGTPFPKLLGMRPL